MVRPKFSDSAVAEVFATYAPAPRKKLIELRDIIYQVAATTEGVGTLGEALRWQQPSYLTPETGSGSTIRIDAVKGQPDRYAMYFHCQTGLVDHFKQIYPNTFKYEGNRAMIFNVADELPQDELRHCVSLALTYHLRKVSKSKARK
jgi:Domain of unknown function (DU1801)